MDIQDQTVIGDIVANDYHAASVFYAHNIDFCCRGHRTLAEVCESKSLDKANLIAELTDALDKDLSENEDYASWQADRLADHLNRFITVMLNSRFR